MGCLVSPITLVIKPMKQRLLKQNPIPVLLLTSANDSHSRHNPARPDSRPQYVLEATQRDFQATR